MSKVKFDPDTDIPDLANQVIIVTGGNVGLGLETIRQLAKHNPGHIYLASRSKEKAEAAIKDLTASNPKFSAISFLSLDLSSFTSIKAAAETFKKAETRLDVLVNNAGIMMVPEGLTKEGYEIHFGTNVIGPALFTQLLLPTLHATAKINPETRVVNLSSGSERVAPTDIYNFQEIKTTMSGRHTTARYALSKLADIHYSNALAKQHKDLKIISVHPGMVATNLHHNSTGVFLRPFLYSAILFATPVQKGAHSQIWAATSPEARTGEYYSPVGVRGKGSKQSKNLDLQEKLWDWIQLELKEHV